MSLMSILRFDVRDGLRFLMFILRFDVPDVHHLV